MPTHDAATIAATIATPEKAWWPRFLEILRASANVRLACSGASIDRTTAYRHRKKYKGFAAAWDDAIEDACDILEAVAWQRARSVSDLLLIFLLKAHRPAMYRETTRHEHSGGIAVALTWADFVREAGSDGQAKPGTE